MQALISVFGIDWHLLLVQGFNFIILAVLLTWLLYKPVLKMIRTREEFIAKGIEDAEIASQKLATADDEAAKVVHGAETEAEGIVSTARESASAERARIVREAEERAASVERDAQARAKEDAARALRDSEKEIARLAMLAAQKVLQQK